MELRRRSSPLPRGGRGSQERGDEILRPVLDDATDVERVAHLAIQGVQDGGPETRFVGAPSTDQPCAAGAMETHREPGLASHGAQLLDRRSGAARHREREERVREQRVPRRPRRRAQERCRCDREAGLGQRWTQRVLLDGARRAQRIRADAEHHRVAAPQDARGVGEHVRSALEHEADDPQRGAALLHPPALMVDRLHQGVPARGRVAPRPQTRHHVRPHAGRQHQAGGAAARAPGRPRHPRRWRPRSARTRSRPPTAPRSARRTRLMASSGDGGQLREGDLRRASRPGRPARGPLSARAVARPCSAR